MPENTPDHDIPYPSPSDPIRGSTGDYILTDLRDLALGTDSAITTAVDTRAPVSHTHTQAQIGGLSAALASAGETAQWGSVSGKPSTYPPSAHSHAVSDVTGLAARLAALEYSSGPRNMTGEAILAPSSGDITLFRHGGMVTISLNRCVFDINSSVSLILNLPYAFRPKVVRYETAVTDGSGNPTAGSFQVDGGGAVYLHRITAGQSVRATLTFPTSNPAPDFPPGTSY